MNANFRYWTLGVAVGCATLLSTAGCLKRYERITVAKDGAVKVALYYEGDEGDFKGPDALPGPQSGWQLERETRTEDGKQKVELVGNRAFPAGAKLPTSFAAPSDPDAYLYLDFPTTVKLEQRPDGAYYYFRRVYTPRRWAYVNFWKESILDEVKDIAEKAPEDLKRDECLKLLKAFGNIEAAKQLEFAREALSKCDPKLAPEHWLRARQALRDSYENLVDWDKLAETYTMQDKQDKDERDRKLQQEAERVLQASHDALVASLRQHAEYDDAQVAAFEREYARARKYFEVTESHDAHLFHVQVVLPGELIAHNGELANVEEVDGTEGAEGAAKSKCPSWEFTGAAFRDRPFELLAVSRVPRTTNDD